MAGAASVKPWIPVLTAHLCPQKLRFLVVGALNTFVGYGLFAFIYLISSDKFHYIIPAGAAHFLSVTFSFLTQRYLVFRSKGPWLHEYIKFQLAYLTILPVSFGLLLLFHEVVGWSVLIAQAGALVITVALGYFASSRFTFRQS